MVEDVFSVEILNLGIQGFQKVGTKKALQMDIACLYAFV